MSMRTTLDLDTQTMEALLKISQQKTKTQAVTQAIREFVRRHQLEELKALKGKLPLKLDWRRLEREELCERRRSRG